MQNTSQAIAKLRVQMGQIANHMNEREKGKLPSQPIPNPRIQFVCQSLCTGKSMCNQLSHWGLGDKWTIKWFFLKRTLLCLQGQESSNNEERDAEPSKATRIVQNPPRSFVPKAPYLDRLLAPKKGGKFEDILEVFKQVQINIPFLDVIQQVSSYAKFLKDLITVKRRTRAAQGCPTTLGAP